MNDPHVVALNYRIKHHSSVDYDNASPLDHSEVAFEIHVERNHVRFAMSGTTKFCGVKATVGGLNCHCGLFARRCNAENANQNVKKAAV